MIIINSKHGCENIHCEELKGRKLECGTTQVEMNTPTFNPDRF